jgi:tetratricopeptide (TPR) repeat protein
MATSTSLAQERGTGDPSWSALIVEAAPGLRRRRWLERQAQDMTASGGRVFAVSCDFDSGGLWAGANELFSALLPEIQAQRPDLIERHIFELVHVLPQLRRSFSVRNPTLTDLASDEEKVRNYAADRAFRIVHGLIDLLDSWKRVACPDTPWVIACDAYDAIGPISSRFFRELMRRRSRPLRLRLVAAVRPGKGAETCAALSTSVPSEVLAAQVAEEPPAVPEPAEAARTAAELEARAGSDRIERQIHLPEMIRLWTAAGRMDKVARCKYFGLSFYCNLGFYEDALRYGDGLLQLVTDHVRDDDRLHLRWWTMIKLINGNTGAGNAEAALEIAEGDALKLFPQVPPAWQCQLLYLTAMLYARYRKPRDFNQGEELLDRGLAAVQHPDVPEADRHFQSVFNRNGVAMIRSFQGRHDEARELCRQGIEELNAYLGADQHRLHRSILHYNMAQVYVATGSFEEAIEYYTAAMDMDPGYSEYYNERASIFFRLGRLEEARADYCKAIELSPPYFEVFTNLGQCYRRMGALEKAIECYSRALDLEPNQTLALLGRAKSHEETGHVEAAIADYTAALAIDSAQWEALASRGALYYEVGDLKAALLDLDRAVELKPQEGDLHQNRAVVLSDLGRRGEAIADLEAAIGFTSCEEEKLGLRARLEAERQSGSA